MKTISSKKVRTDFALVLVEKELPVSSVSIGYDMERHTSALFYEDGFESNLIG